MAEKSFEKIVIFEQRSKVGGLWIYTPEDHVGAKFTVPQTDPSGFIESPIWRKSPVKSAGGTNGYVPYDGHKSQSSEDPVFVSPMYDALETNTPRPLMAYSDYPFSDGTQLFPKHESVRRYLEEYASEVKNLVRFETQVLDVRPKGHQPSQRGELSDQWMVKSKRLGYDQPEIEEEFDAVVAASGHYSLPYVPDIDGIREWNELHPGTISHSKFFRKPNNFKDKVSTSIKPQLHRALMASKKVVVVGSSASGLDIGGQIASVCRLPFHSSAKSVSHLEKGFTETRKLVHPPISRLIPIGRKVAFEDGHVEDDVDHILFCTGYFYSFPFLSSLDPPLITHGRRVEHTYQQLFYTIRPTLALIGLPRKVVPFQVAEVQSAIVARAFAGRLQLPSYEEMAKWEATTVEEKGADGEFHSLMFPHDVNYINELHDWAMTARTLNGKPASDVGKKPPKWRDWEFWARQRVVDIKRAFVEKGEHRIYVQHFEEIGFDFEAWKHEQKSGL